MSWNWKHWLWIAAVVALLTGSASAPARAAEAGATVRTVAGAGMTIGGLALIPISVEYGLADGSFEGTMFLGWTAPVLLAPGISTLVEGLVQLGIGDGAVPDARFLGPWGRARMANWAPMYLVGGGLACSLGLTAAIALGSSGAYLGVPSFVLPGVGAGMLGTGIALAIDGERAMQQLPGELNGTPEEPGEIYIKSGIILFAMGTGLLVGVTPATRLALASEPQIGPWSVIAPAALGVGYLVGGISMLIAGIQRKARGWDAPTASRSTLRLRVSGIAPVYDPTTETVALTIQGFTW